MTKMSKESCPDLMETCSGLLSLLSERKTLEIYLQERERFEASVGSEVTALVRMVSLELQKAKAQLYKGSSGMGEVLRPCEERVRELCRAVEENQN
jgi:PII-like signaling protein